MKNSFFKIAFPLVFAIAVFNFKASSQVSQLQHICSLYFSPEYISDGQEYFAQLKPDQKTEFRTTFFGDNTYRIVACTNLKRSDVVFSVLIRRKTCFFRMLTMNIHHTGTLNFRQQ
ncbi:MAG TPA: hypothetical protein PLV65_10170 [Tenuifilaceae bacterium]|nr:hypothetical protein [Tenuifilaceae bacterium]